MSPESLTNDGARDLFKQSGLTYAILTKKTLASLRSLVNEKMKASGCFNDSYRCKQRAFIHDGGADRFYAGIRCKAFYFEDREAVSFNPDGFIGFAGWASSSNVKPILEGFAEWVKEVSE